MSLLRSETPPPPASLDVGTPPPSAQPTSAQLKAAIDGGLTGDKAPHGDVGAAPLGTCEEAGGAPPTARDLSLAQRSQTVPPRIRRRVDPHGERGFVMPLFWTAIAGIAGALGLGLLVL